uniref:Uncharacterized protein n=1 Tax=viral metagenome TaxID=1070528 RepID=A0A2V0RIS5_9ZZZZ
MSKFVTAAELEAVSNATRRNTSRFVNAQDQRDTIDGKVVTLQDDVVTLRSDLTSLSAGLPKVARFRFVAGDPIGAGLNNSNLISFVATELRAIDEISLNTGVLPTVSFDINKTGLFRVHVDMYGVKAAAGTLVSNITLYRLAVLQLKSNNRDTTDPNGVERYTFTNSALMEAVAADALNIFEVNQTAGDVTDVEWLVTVVFFEL